MGRMRVTDFLRKFKGDFVVEILTRGELEILKEGTLEELIKECDNSFDALDGFDNPIWEKPVQNFVIKNNKLFIAVEK